MKKILLIIGVAASTIAFGQSNKAGVMQAGLGWGSTLGGASIDFTQTISGISSTTTQKGIGANVNYGIRGQYGINDLLSAGVFIRKTSAAYVVTDINSSTTMSTSGFSFGVEGKVYAVNHDKFNLYFAPNVGFTTASTRNYDSYFSIDGSASGLNYGLTSGIDWYWADFIGMSADMGYDHSSLSGTFNDAIFKDTKYKINNGGFYIGVGLIVKFGG